MAFVIDDHESNELFRRIMTTRFSWINAERRILKKERFFQFLNVYYSFCTIVGSVLAYVHSDNNLSLLTIFMSIFLLVAILYLNSQKYPEIACDYRKKYVNLYRLEFELNDISSFEKERFHKITDEYCRLLESTNNHSAFDYYCALHDEDRGTIGSEIKYWLGTLGRKLIEGGLLLLPVVAYILID